MSIPATEEEDEEGMAPRLSPSLDALIRKGWDHERSLRGGGNEGTGFAGLQYPGGQMTGGDRDAEDQRAGQGSGEPVRGVRATGRRADAQQWEGEGRVQGESEDSFDAAVEDDLYGDEEEEDVLQTHKKRLVAVEGP
jgi:hypothetical protein